MSINKSYAVFGLGRYGRAVAKELLDNGVAVLAVDRNRKLVDELAGEIPLCKCADITVPGVIEQLGIADFDVVIIAIAGNFEATVMATMLCKEAGVKRVIVKCAESMQKTILEKIGADEVVFPENEYGIRLAKNILSSGFLDIADISENISVLEINPREEWIGKTLRELELRKKYSVNVIALKTGRNIDIAADPDALITEGMKFIVIADKRKIKKM